MGEAVRPHKPFQIRYGAQHRQAHYQKVFKSRSCESLQSESVGAVLALHNIGLTPERQAIAYPARPSI